MLITFIDQFQLMQRKITRARNENEEGELLYAMCHLRLRIGRCAEDYRKSGNVPAAEALERLAYEIWRFEEVVRQGPPPEQQDTDDAEETEWLMELHRSFVR